MTHHLPGLSCLPRRAFVAGGLSLFVAAASPGAFAQARALPLAQAINRAGKLRALSQRVSKAYVQAALAVLPEKAQDILTTTHQLILSSLSELAPAAAAPELRQLHAGVERDSRSMLDGARARPTREGALEVARTADTVLEGANKLTAAFEAQGAGANARIVNVAGRQRMLSQRAARAFFLASAGHDTPAVRQQLTGARAEFIQGLASLQAAAISTPAIRNELELARSQWMFYESALNRPGAPDALQTVATTSERVYEVMDNLTALYEAALRDLL